VPSCERVGGPPRPPPGRLREPNGAPCPSQPDPGRDDPGPSESLPGQWPWPRCLGGRGGGGGGGGGGDHHGGGGGWMGGVGGGARGPLRRTAGLGRGWRTTGPGGPGEAPAARDPAPTPKLNRSAGAESLLRYSCDANFPSGSEFGSNI
jgi:hypothetical protein